MLTDSYFVHITRLRSHMVVDSLPLPFLRADKLFKVLRKHGDGMRASLHHVSDPHKPIDYYPKPITDDNQPSQPH